MSTPLNFTSPVGKVPAPKGTEVASFRTYAEAQSAVDALAEADYPVHTLTIIGTDLVMVERVTGRATAGKAFARGALNGLWWGVMLGLLSAFINPDLGGAAIIITAGVITLLWADQCCRARDRWQEAASGLHLSYLGCSFAFFSACPRRCCKSAAGTSRRARKYPRSRK